MHRGRRYDQSMTVRSFVALTFAATLIPLPAEAQGAGFRGLADRDLPYVDAGHERQRLDLYRPAGFDPASDEPLPVIVWIHGGGWQQGSKANCLPLREGYVGRGYAVASIGYRLTDAARWPAQIDDCRAAIRWLRDHAGEYGLDADRIGVWGASAGGHLAAMVTLAGDDDLRASERGGERSATSARVRCGCYFYGPTDLIAFGRTPGPGYGERVSAPNSPEHKLLGGPIEQNLDTARVASPITYVSPDDPPLLMVHGTNDSLVPLDQSERLFDALQSAGVPVGLHLVRGGGHGRPGFRTPAVTERIAAFFERHLQQDDPPRMPTERTESDAPATSKSKPKQK